MTDRFKNSVAVVTGQVSSANVTVPGPLTFDHRLVVVAGGSGRPSSVTEPWSDAAAGSVIVWLGPAETTGGVFVGPPPPPGAESSNSLPSFSLELEPLSTARSTMRWTPRRSGSIR